MLEEYPIVYALLALRPGAEWHMPGETLDDLIWLDTTQTRPTDAEIIAAAP